MTLGIVPIVLIAVGALALGIVGTLIRLEQKAS